jgi:hypothetical protein
MIRRHSSSPKRLLLAIAVFKASYLDYATHVCTKKQALFHQLPCSVV